MWATGQSLRDAGTWTTRWPSFRRPTGSIRLPMWPQQEIRRTTEMIERNKKQSGKPDNGAARQGDKDDEKSLTPSELARKRSQERTDLLQPLPELKPLNNELIDLKMANQRPRMSVRDRGGRLAGINVLFDPEYDQQQTIRRLSIDLCRRTTLNRRWIIWR